MVALIAASLIARLAYLAYRTFVWEIRLLLSTKSEPNVIFIEEDRFLAAF